MSESHDRQESESILVVDDDDTFRERVMRSLRARGFEVRGASTPADALVLAREDSPELALVDLRMPEGYGLDLVRELLAIDPATRVVVLTGYGSIATAIEAIRIGAHHYLQKPADADEIVRAFRRGPEPVSGAQQLEVPSLARVEWEHIQRVLTDCDGNVSHAARLLGVHRRSLQRKLGKQPGR
ncbi:MAG: response regulator [Deltaproteobacteria bacterium]|nr:response regulator [Deltaproteobacteria bacterium]